MPLQLQCAANKLAVTPVGGHRCNARRRSSRTAGRQMLPRAAASADSPDPQGAEATTLRNTFILLAAAASAGAYEMSTTGDTLMMYPLVGGAVLATVGAAYASVKSGEQAADKGTEPTTQQQPQLMRWLGQQPQSQEEQQQGQQQQPQQQQLRPMQQTGAQAGTVMQPSSPRQMSLMQVFQPLQQQDSAMAFELEQAKQEAAELAAQLEAVQYQAAELAGQLDAARRDADAAQEMLVSARSRTGMLEKAYASKYEEAIKFEKDVKSLRGQKKNLASELDRKQQEAAALAAQVAEAARDAEAAKTLLAAAKGRSAVLEKAWAVAFQKEMVKAP